MVRTDHTSHYAAELGRLSETVFRTEPDWLRDARSQALDRFMDTGFPLPSDEEWRFTPIGPIAETPFRVLSGSRDGAAVRLDPGLLTMGDLECARLVFVDGRLSPEHCSASSLPTGGVVGGLAAAVISHPDEVRAAMGSIAGLDGHAFSALNAAFALDGAFVYVPAGTVFKMPVHLLSVSTGQAEAGAAHLRHLIVAGPGSSASVIEEYVAAGAQPSPRTVANPYLLNHVTELQIGPNAWVEHYKLQNEDVGAYHVGRMAVRMERDSRLTSHVVASGGAIARNDLGVRLDGEGIECTLNGLYLARGRQLTDNHTVVDHAMPNCSSHELYKGILSDNGHGVFNGKVFVRPDAQKTDAKQTNHALLLSDGAHIDTKPQLEIFADDVRCTHGATVGRLDADALFYLRSRGISAVSARAALVQAFAGEVVERMALSDVRTRLESALSNALASSFGRVGILGSEDLV